MSYILSILYPVITGLSVAMMLLFYLRSERFNDKLIKKEDELLQLADKDDFFERKKGFLRDDERLFFESLKRAVGDKYYIFPQIHLSDLLKVKDNSRDHENLYLSLGQKSIDYVVFSKDGIVPILALELNGKSHLFKNRMNRDKTVESLLNKAGINFLPIQKEEYFNDSTIKKIFALL